MRLIDTRVTHLELRQRPAERVAPPRGTSAIDLVCVSAIPLSFYRYLYGQVGRAHHWTSRLLSDEKLAAEIHKTGIAVHVLYVDKAPAGWFEIDFVHLPHRTRIVHFGILPEFRGRGLARYLLAEAVQAAFAGKPGAVTLETNTLDHPAALSLYRSFGFVPVGTRLVSTKAIDE